jgi:hypothetical protein
VAKFVFLNNRQAITAINIEQIESFVYGSASGENILTLTSGQTIQIANEARDSLVNAIRTDEVRVTGQSSRPGR